MLPSLPDIRLELVEDLTPPQQSGFLRLVRRRLRCRFADGSHSEAFDYDEVDRRALDAVVMAAYFTDAQGSPSVYLRSALRPPLVFRDRARSPMPALDPAGSIWELPAGLVEADEQTLEGVRASAARELKEELGFDVGVQSFQELGPSVFPAAGFIAERHFFFAVEVDPALRQEPSLDGSALEDQAVIAAVPLAEALAACRDGRIIDAKTELALRRLRELLP